MKAGKTGKGDNCKVTNALPGAYAAERIKDRLRAELDGHPELIKQMCDIAENAKTI